MTKHPLHFTAQFEDALDGLLATGRLSLLRAQALEDALGELSEDPMRHDSVREGLSEPHWIKICRATGGIDTGLRVVYLLHEEGMVYLDGLYLAQAVP